MYPEWLCFLILLLNMDRVGALRIDSSVLFHNLRVDGKNDDSNEDKGE